MKTMKKIVAIMAVALMLCSILPLSVMAADTYELASSIEVGDTVVLACKDKKMELSGISTTSTKYGIGVAYSSAPAGAYVLTVEAGSTSGTYSFKCPNGQYLYWTSGNSLATNATKSANTSWKVTFSGTSVTIVNAKDNSRKLQWNASSPRFACYTSGQTAVQLFKKVSAPDVSTCEHKNAQYEHNCQPTICPDCEETLPALTGHTYNENVTLAPTCTTAGEKTLTCACGDVKTETIAAPGHTYEDGFCSACGEEEPAISEYTISFATANQRVSQDGNQQLWKNAALTFINNKAASTNAIVSNVNPVRLYASSEIIVECAGMTKIVFDCNSNDYATALKNSIGAAATISGDKVTVTLDGEDSFTIAKLSAQVRLDSMTVTVEKKVESDCEHDYVGTETQAPTCSAEGVMTYTCSKCQESYTEAIAVIPHNYVEDIIDSTCTTTGTKTYECSVCGNSYDEVIPVKPHNYVDDVCADCGHVKAYKGTIDFSNAEQRTELTTQIQIWTNEGLTFTNNKLTGNNIADYTDPIRIYKNSGIVIEFPEMAKLIIDASGIGNDYLWDATLEAAGLSFTVANGIYTITFAEAVNSLNLTCANQVRANSITAIVAHECVYDNACDADCNKCGTIREVGEHTYANDFDTTCDVCGAERAVAGPVSYIARSVSEDVNGLAMLFEVKAEGIVVKAGTFVQADFTNATYNGYKLLGVGVKASNGDSETNIEGVRMYDLEDGNAKFAFRVINIPADKLAVEITMTPYYIVEIDGVATTIYGTPQTASYNQVASENG